MHNPKILEKGKQTSHTIASLTVFVRAFCHMRIENLLKGPELIYQAKINKQQAKNNKQQAKSNKQQAKSNKQ